MGPSASPYSVGVPEEGTYAAEYPARTFPCQRFDAALASSSAWLGADVGRYFTFVWLLHSLHLAGFNRRTRRRNMKSAA